MVKNEPVSANTTQEKILCSAREVFMSKGMEGARMQEIADHAGINKALLHYYFKNKETLFHAIFEQALFELLPALTEVFRSDRPLLDKISDFFTIHIGFIQANPLIPHFIIAEVSRNPDMILKSFQPVSENGLFEKFSNDVNDSILKGEIQPIDPLQLIINLLSLSVFPFIAKPLLTNLLGMDELQFEQFLEKRKPEVTCFVKNALK